jgi:hypothetical protein
MLTWENKVLSYFTPKNIFQLDAYTLKKRLVKWPKQILEIFIYIFLLQPAFSRQVKNILMKNIPVETLFP